MQTQLPLIMQQHENTHDGDLAVQAAQPKLKEPSMYQVIMLNDDYTPMDFVVLVLQEFFYKSADEAMQIMLAVHNQGQAVCGVFTKDVAETKAVIVNQYAREQQHPLLCKIAPISD